MNSRYISIIKTFHKRNFIVENKKLCLVYVLYNIFDNSIILVTSKKLKNEYLKTCYHSNYVIFIKNGFKHF